MSHTPRPDAIAAIDIGSDTVHLLVGVPQPATEAAGGAGAPRSVERVASKVELLELGRDVAQDGSVGAHEAHELRRIMERFVATARGKAETVVIGATEALRVGSDGPALVERLEQHLGLPIRILSGAREAALGLLGASGRLDTTGVQLLIDSGGASTEVTICIGRTASSSASLPVGAALLGAALRGDPPDPLSWALAGSMIGQALVAAPEGTPARAFATGGSAHNLAGLERMKGRRGPTTLTAEGLAKVARELLANSSSALARRTGEDQRRIAILPPGLLIVASVLQHYDLDRVTVVPEGLREGMILAVATLGDGWWRDEQPGPSDAPTV